ncbi:hypothetical protein C5S39_13330, partial [Candidatus Methanophagaceae archaeon]
MVASVGVGVSVGTGVTVGIGAGSEYLTRNALPLAVSETAVVPAKYTQSLVTATARPLTPPDLPHVMFQMRPPSVLLYLARAALEKTKSDDLLEPAKYTLSPVAAVADPHDILLSVILQRRFPSLSYLFMNASTPSMTPAIYTKSPAVATARLSSPPGPPHVTFQTSTGCASAKVTGKAEHTKIA